MARLSQTATGSTLAHVTDDAFLLAHTPDPTLPVAPAVRDLRAALAASTADLLAIPDSALETGWPWRDDEADVRYGLYRAIEAIEEATVERARILRDTGASRSPAGRDRTVDGVLAGLAAELAADARSARVAAGV